MPYIEYNADDFNLEDALSDFAYGRGTYQYIYFNGENQSYAKLLDKQPDLCVFVDARSRLWILSTTEKSLFDLKGAERIADGHDLDHRLWSRNGNAIITYHIHIYKKGGK